MTEDEKTKHEWITELGLLLDYHLSPVKHELGQIKGDLSWIENRLRQPKSVDSIELLKASLREMRGKPVLVPDCIKIDCNCEDTGALGIAFNDFKQVLYIDNGLYMVGESEQRMFVKCKLTPCKRDELRLGDVAHYSDDELDEINEDENYCVILDDDRHVFINGANSACVSCRTFGFWYKVERVEP